MRWQRSAPQLHHLLAEVRALGRTPREHEPSDDAGQEAERAFAQQLRTARAAGSFEPWEEAELDELAARGRHERTERALRPLINDAYAAAGAYARRPSSAARLELRRSVGRVCRYARFRTVLQSLCEETKSF